MSLPLLTAHGGAGEEPGCVAWSCSESSKAAKAPPLMRGNTADSMCKLKQRS